VFFPMRAHGLTGKVTLASVRERLVKLLPEVIGAAAIGVAAIYGCSRHDSVSGLYAGLRTINAEVAVEEAIAREHAYAIDAVQVMVSPTQLRVLIQDAKLAESDAATRASAAAAIIPTLEKRLINDVDFGQVQVISVSIVHPATWGANGSAAHVEEVFEFRRGAGANFTRG
jgi:hypothetical protein